MKISTGDLIQNIKYFMFITNRYGKPSEQYVDSFIETFGNSIYNNNFIVNETMRSNLDFFWGDVKSDLEFRGLLNLAEEDYGFNFYMQLSKDKDSINTEIDLRNYIKEFSDKHIVTENLVDTKLTDDDIRLIGNNSIEFNFNHAYAKINSLIRVVFENNSSTDEQEVIDINRKTGAVIIRNSKFKELIDKEYSRIEIYLIYWIKLYMKTEHISDKYISNYTMLVNSIKYTDGWQIVLGTKKRKALRIIVKEQ